MSTVVVNTYTHSVTYVADNILKSLKDIILLSGLDPANFIGEWESNLRATRTWLNSGDLQKTVLEIYDPATDELIGRWDIDIAYGWSGGDGNFWTDTDQLRYAIRKAGIAPIDAKYRLVLENKPGRPDVAGWSSTTFRSTDGMVRQSLGTTIEHSGLGANTSYLRKAS
jgi:hypothetical protein